MRLQPWRLLHLRDHVAVEFPVRRGVVREAVQEQHVMLKAVRDVNGGADAVRTAMPVVELGEVTASLERDFLPLGASGARGESDDGQDRCGETQVHLNSNEGAS